MTVLRILQYPDPRLKTIATPVENIHAADVQKMINDMLETLENTPHCGGLAATQLDIQYPKCIFVFYDFDENDPHTPQTPVVIVNPKIISTEGRVFEQEGCMSVCPDHIHASIHRPEKTRMQGLNREGKTIEFTRSGYLAKNFIHETDHLNGKLYIDHLKPLKRRMLDKKLAKIQRAQTKQ